MPMTPPRHDIRMARAMAARLCHDLSGAVGGLTGTLDLMEEGGEAELLALARETGVALRQRLRLFTAAWGGPTAEQDAAELVALLEGAPAFPRVRFAAEALSPGRRLPAGCVPLALNAALLAAEALPRGGLVRLAGDAAGIAALPVGPVVAWPAATLALLGDAGGAEAPSAGSPRDVLAPFLLALAADAGWQVSLGLGAGPGTGPLLLRA